MENMKNMENKRIYAQVIDAMVQLAGGSEVGLPLPQEYLDENTRILNIDITDLEPQPKVGWFYIDDKFTEEDTRPKPPEPIYTTEQLRNLLYKTATKKIDASLLIEFSNVSYSCDKAMAQVKVYEEEERFEEGNRSMDLGRLWVAGKNYIRELDLGQLKEMMILNGIAFPTDIKSTELTVLM